MRGEPIGWNLLINVKAVPIDETRRRQFLSLQCRRGLELSHSLGTCRSYRYKQQDQKAALKDADLRIAPLYVLEDARTSFTEHVLFSHRSRCRAELFTINLGCSVSRPRVFATRNSPVDFVSIHDFQGARRSIPLVRLLGCTTIQIDSRDIRMRLDGSAYRRYELWKKSGYARRPLTRPLGLIRST